jgi:hypothetical protein
MSALIPHDDLCVRMARVFDVKINCRPEANYLCMFDIAAKLNEGITLKSFYNKILIKAQVLLRSATSFTSLLTTQSSSVTSPSD